MPQPALAACLQSHLSLPIDDCGRGTQLMLLPKRSSTRRPRASSRTLVRAGHSTLGFSMRRESDPVSRCPEGVRPEEDRHGRSAHTGAVPDTMRQGQTNPPRAVEDHRCLAKALFSCMSTRHACSVGGSGPSKLRPPPRKPDHRSPRWAQAMAPPLPHAVTLHRGLAQRPYERYAHRMPSSLVRKPVSERHLPLLGSRRWGTTSSRACMAAPEPGASPSSTPRSGQAGVARHQGPWCLAEHKRCSCLLLAHGQDGHDAVVARHLQLAARSESSMWLDTVATNRPVA